MDFIVSFFFFHIETQPHQYGNCTIKYMYFPVKSKFKISSLKIKNIYGNSNCQRIKTYLKWKEAHYLFQTNPITCLVSHSLQ